MCQRLDIAALANTMYTNVFEICRLRHRTGICMYVRVCVCMYVCIYVCNVCNVFIYICNAWTYVRKTYVIHVCIYIFYVMCCMFVCPRILWFMKAHMYVFSNSRVFVRRYRNGDVSLQLEILEHIFNVRSICLAQHQIHVHTGIYKSRWC